MSSSGGSKGHTLIHVTHEAVEHIGGIGTVLEGLLTSRVYRGAVARSILVAPLWNTGSVRDPMERLGSEGTELWYSGLDEIDARGLGARLKPIEWAFRVRLVYGKRRFVSRAAGGETGEAELLLVDLRGIDHQRIDRFKALLYERFEIDSLRFSGNGDYELWVGLAPPAYAALMALLGEADFPAILFSHEYMGMPTALLASTDAHRRIRTVFHAHECSTARDIVEHSVGQDIGFYQAMRDGVSQGKHVEDVFGDRDASYRHQMVRNAHRLDVALAVGDATAEELKFLSPEMERSNVALCYNGLLGAEVTLDSKKKSRGLVLDWVERVTGSRPDLIFTHVTRPVVSKGLWRDLKLCARMERALKERGQRAVSILLTCGASPRSFADVKGMAERYGWPMDHHEGYPDLVGPEVGLWREISVFNNPARSGSGAITAMLVNQYGFSRDRLGPAAPPDLTIADLRRAADVEFGMSIYEPFGIAQLEPLHAGAICVPSSVCGCYGFARKALREEGIAEEDAKTLVVADFTSVRVADPLHLSRTERERIEDAALDGIAERLLARLPRNDADRAALIEEGQRLARRMDWDAIVKGQMLPALEGIVRD
ncbi:MAG: hypothetical protein VYC34_09005 [Planctomycetota bacterium]|nr:hypothetical protein [Planctomycetota bacterium]